MTKNTLLLGGFFNINKIKTILKFIKDNDEKGFIIVDERGDQTFSEHFEKNIENLIVVNLHFSKFFDYENLTKDIDKIDFDNIILNNKKIILSLPPLKVSETIINKLKLYISMKLLNTLKKCKNVNNFIVFFEKSNFFNQDENFLNSLISVYTEMLELNNNLNLYFSFDGFNNLDLFKKFLDKIDKVYCLQYYKDININIKEYLQLRKDVIYI